MALTTWLRSHYGLALSWGSAMRHVQSAVFLAGAIAASSAHAQGYDAFKQFSIKANPAASWSYVSNGNLLTAKVKTCNGINKDYCWTNGGNGFPDVAAVEANKTGGTLKYADVVLPAGYVDLDPENVGNVAFQWTAPEAGIVKVTGNFLGVATDEGSHTVSVQHNGISLQSFTISAYGQKEAFKATVSVNRGDMITFVSVSGNGGGALSTGLQAKIVYQ
jgi:hypothetical protein